MRHLLNTLFVTSENIYLSLDGENVVASREKEAVANDVTLVQSERASAVIAGLGGKDNLEEVDCCATRLRVTVKDGSKVNDAALKATGARGVIVRGNGVQVIYGPHVTIIKNEVEEILS